MILNIPLSPCLPPDRLIWKDSKDGKFLIRSAYHLGLCLNDLYKRQCSRGLEEKLIWKFLWSLMVPNQVKTFTWRACHDILPTKSNLLKRKVIEEDICPCCNLEKETLFHAIWLWRADTWGTVSRPPSPFFLFFNKNLSKKRVMGDGFSSPTNHFRWLCPAAQDVWEGLQVLLSEVQHAL
jgi:hypothetical protein